MTKEAQEKLREEASKNADENTDENAKKEKNPLSIQPYEIFTLTVRGKYFFDKTFGGALVPGQRNQIAADHGV